jgi:hypothetical protein
MRLSFFSRPLAVAALCISNAAPAAEHKISSKEGTEPKSASSLKAADKAPAGAADLFGKPAVFRGTLGDMQLQVTVRRKEIIDDGLEGEYFMFGRSQKVLLAGELEGDNIFLEESENGTNISGQWEGKLQGDSIHGTWMSADGSVSMPFNLKLIRPPANSSKPTQLRKAPTAENATYSGRR